MATGNSFAADLWAHILNNAPLPGLGDPSGCQPSLVPGVLSVALHTADPGDAGFQTTNEVFYTGYTRVQVARNGTGWNIVNKVATPTYNLDFPSREDLGTVINATFFSVGYGTRIIARGALTPLIPINQNTIPRIKTTSTLTFV